MRCDDLLTVKVVAFRLLISRYPTTLPWIIAAF